ncbi:MAG: hypothetical protein ACOYCE_09595 [Limnochordia bacterium]|jgi:hypothetical protein
MGLLIAHIAGAVVSFWLGVQLSLGTVVAASLTGLLGAFIFPKYATAIYCGAFVGMSSAYVLNSFWTILLAASLAALIFHLSSPVFQGYGGKLGTTAFLAVNLTALLAGVQMPSSGAPAPFPLALALVAAVVLGAIGAYTLSIKRGLGAVVGSAAVALAGGLALPALFPDVGGQLAVALCCGAYVGMSTPKVLPSYNELSLAGLLAGLLYLSALDSSNGYGGKLGTIAFIAVIATVGLKTILASFAGAAETPSKV